MSVMKLADGRMINLKTRELVEEESPVAQEVAQLETFAPKPREQMRLEDLPGDARQMNVVCAVLGYKLLGIPDTDIAIALHCTDEALERVLSSSAYDESYTEVLKAFVAGQKESAREVLSSNAVGAANVLVATMRKSKNENNRVRAAESVLSRVGITADSDANNTQGGLRIKIINDTGKQDINISLG